MYEISPFPLKKTEGGKKRLYVGFESGSRVCCSHSQVVEPLVSLCVGKV